MIRIRTRDGKFNGWYPILYDTEYRRAMMDLGGIYYPDVSIMFFDTEEDIHVFLLKTYGINHTT
jgi:hypothetical protein